MILAIDPGSEKCGVALLDENGILVSKQIVSRQNVITSIRSLITQYSIAHLIVGKGAFGQTLEKELTKNITTLDIIFIDEKNSTLEARKLYWQTNPPKGLWKFIPTSLRVPPMPIDDYAAQILGERYLKG
ncbi:MAG: Holliday junction resolvase RuvX [Candidatus Margulisiibacteriota bacterium]